MEYIAVYRREDDPDLDGVPVALFRDGALMQNWHKTTDGVHNREMVVGSVEVPDTVAYSQSIADHYTATAAPTVDAVAFAGMVAEAKARLMQEGMQRAAEEQARAELAADRPSMVTAPVEPTPVPEPEPIPEPPVEPTPVPEPEPSVPVAPLVFAPTPPDAEVTNLDEQSGSVVADEEMPPEDSSAPTDGE